MHACSVSCFSIVLPYIKPIMTFVVITSLIGGMQLFDLPWVMFPGGQGGADQAGITMSVYMYGRAFAWDQSLGAGSAAAFIMFAFIGIFSIIYLVLAALAVICILPLYIMLINATRTNDQVVNGISLVPGGALWDNLQTLILGKLDRTTGARGNGLNVPLGFLNSFIVASAATLTSAYFCSLAAYGFAVYKFRMKAFFWGCVLAVMMIPGSVSQIGYFKLISSLNLLDNFLALILPAGANAFGVFFMRQYMMGSLSMSLIEAARIDGKSEFGIFHSIALPLSMPGIATISILNFLGNWNSYLNPLIVLSNKDMYTMPILIQQLNTSFYNRDLGAMYSGVAISIVPIMIMFAVFSKYMIEGIAAGGVKE